MFRTSILSTRAALGFTLAGLACAPVALAPSPGDDAGASSDAGGTLVDAGLPPVDAGAPDAGALDAGRLDAGEPDAGSERVDAGEPDAGPADAGAADAGPADAGLVFGMPISAPAGAWTWVPFPDSACNDGSPVGIGINPSTTSSNAVMYFNGGGACWDYFTCYIAGAATLGPYDGATQLATDVASTGSVLDRTDPQNPFADWNYVYVPYCTGDVHAGDNVVTYSLGTSSQVFHHVGHANVMAYLARVGPTFPDPGKVLIAGDSAGGAGAAVNYTFARAYWPNAEMYMIDDSLLFFPPSETPAATLASELANWNIQPTLQGICGDATCSSDFSLIYPALRRNFPADRMAVLSYEQDETMSAYYETLPILYQAYLDQLASQVLQPAGIDTYLLNGTGHTILWSWATDLTTQSVNLRDWVTQMVTDSPQWTSTGP